MRKCVTPIGPATFKKSLRLFLFFSCIDEGQNIYYTYTYIYKKDNGVENDDIDGEGEKGLCGQEINS